MSAGFESRSSYWEGSIGGIPDYHAPGAAKVAPAG